MNLKGREKVMTEYADEQIRRAINQAKEQEQIQNQNIYEGITINDRPYEFQAKEFFDESLSMYIPTNFVDMPDELVKLKYPSSDRPKVILTDPMGAIDITFTLLAKNIEDAQIPEVKAGMKRFFQKLNPSYLFFEEGVEIIDGKTIAFFEFKSPTLTEPLFNVMFFVEIGHNAIMGCFNCPYDEYLLWQPVVRQMIQSVRIDKKVEQSPTELPKESVLSSRGGRR